MFKLTDIKSVKWPVTVNVPQDFGTVKKYEFTAQYDVIPQDEFDAFYREAKDGQPAGEKDIGLARRVLTGWGSDFCDENGDPLEYNAENKERAIKISYVRSAIINHYIECSHGKAAEKNS